MEFIGHKNVAIFDLWSICHFLCGVALASILPGITSNKTYESEKNFDLKNELFTVILVLVIAYSWELLEFFCETGGAGKQIAYWLQGKEYYLNRLFGDPFLLLIGYIVGRNTPRFVWPARVILFVWIWVFVFILPHSMAYTKVLESIWN
jgi:hypothetical protein